jgi:uncharacterized protein (TIGR02646 family)
MRPIERGKRPLDKKGNPIVFRTYGDARGYLIERMGQYCSYCNQKLPASLAVEHVQPKDLNPELELEWNNFLLGCTNCNSTKGKKEVILSEFVWPDIHNTHKALKYNEDGTVEVNDNITDPDLRRKIQNLIDLVGLQKYPDTSDASDRRWKNRKDAFQKAALALRLYRSSDAKGAGEEAATLVAKWAPDSGFFSIWLNTFEEYKEVKRELIKAFPGTAENAFDKGFKAINRTSEL